MQEDVPLADLLRNVCIYAAYWTFRSSPGTSDMIPDNYLHPLFAFTSPWCHDDLVHVLYVSPFQHPWYENSDHICQSDNYKKALGAAMDVLYPTQTMTRRLNKLNRRPVANRQLAAVWPPAETPGLFKEVPQLTSTSVGFCRNCPRFSPPQAAFPNE